MNCSYVTFRRVLDTEEAVASYPVIRKRKI